MAKGVTLKQEINENLRTYLTAEIAYQIKEFKKKMKRSEEMEK